MRQGFLRSSRYSPGNMDRDSLEALFVGREDVMNDVLHRVEDSIGQTQKHYILLIGPRGAGKTHFLALAHHRIRDQVRSAGLEDKVAIAFLKEEEWGVASFLDFLVRILRALAEQTPELVPNIEQIYELFSYKPAEAEAFAMSLITEFTEGKTLLLLCENLVELFHGLDDDGQKRWRAAIQQSGNWSIVATTPALFTGLQLQVNPFYGFFTIRHLEGIDVETGLELLVKKAQHQDEQELASFLRTPLGRARVRAIHHLAAGNYRAYVVLFDFLDKESLDDLIEPFMHMIDDLTPYYQDRMHQIPPAQRKIVEFLSMQSTPMLIKDIAAACLMSPQTASKQIAELAAAKFIDRIRHGRNTYCELSEPLMRLCFEVKDNRTKHFRLFVEFLRHWFSTRELERRLTALQHDDDAPLLDLLHVEEALRCFHADRLQPLVKALHDEAEHWLDAENYHAFAKAQEALVRERGDSKDFEWWAHALDLAEDYPGVIAAVEEANRKYPPTASILYDAARAYAMVRRLEDAIEAINRALELEPKDIAPYLCLRADILLDLKRYDEVIPVADAVLAIEPDHWHSHFQAARVYFAQGRDNDAQERITELIQLAPENPRALRMAADCFNAHGKFTDALKIVDQALALDEDDPKSHRLRGFILCDMADYQSASDAFREVITRDPNDVSAHCRLSDTLLAIGEFDEALDVAGRLIELEPDHTHALYARGRALIELDRVPEAIEELDNLLTTEDFYNLTLAAEESRRISHYESAARYLDRAVELRPDDPECWRERALLYLDIKDYDSAVNSVAKVEMLSPNSLATRLLSMRVAAATNPLDGVFKQLNSNIHFDWNAILEDETLDDLSTILSVSVSAFGPRYIHEGILVLRDFFADAPLEGILGILITDFLLEISDEIEGSLEEWDVCLKRLADSLSDLMDTEIPLQMLNAEVRYAKTGDKKHLLELPLEQRQLLLDVLPKQDL